MDAPLYAAAPTVRLPDPPSRHPGPDGDPGPVADLLRQMIDLQREHLAVLKAQVAAQDGLARWRAFLARWQGEFPGVGAGCKEVLPQVERAYLALVQDVADKLRDDPAVLDSEFALAEFLDRYGIRLAQLGAVLGQLGPLADAAPPA